MSSDDDDDEYIIHGQLLDPIQEDEIVKRKDTEQQFVKDENGRRRFHGAFTGGFSAGFYNTVGSLEGWTPSTFKSSRTSKIAQKTQNAYDFMDEEDKKDLGIDSSKLKIKAEYSDLSSRKRQLPEINSGPIPGKPVLGEILKPISDTWGVELLKTMGWKPGQGVGPQLTQQEKLQTKKELENVGMKFKTNMKYDEDDFEVNELLKNFKVSPYEYESKVIKPKVDTFGLGYEGLKSTTTSIKSTNLYSKLTVGGKSIHGQAFGVGAYEDDDDDIYATDNMSNYDFTLDDKNQKSKNKSKINKLDPECIDGFVECISKHDMFDEHSSPVQIPPEWRPQGMFERIVGKCPPDLFTQSSSLSLVNVNTRQRETKKPEPQTSVEQYVEKEVPNLLSDIISDRFTRAVLPDDSTNALIPVIRTIDPEIQRLKDYAEKKMFGFWTRKTDPWIPDKLLCKRFNVPVPKQSIINYTDDGKKRGECSLFSSLEFASNQPLFNHGSKIPNIISLTKNDMNFDNNEANEPSQIQPHIIEDFKVFGDTTERQKPSVDFFKDIFLDDCNDETLNEPKTLKTEKQIPTNFNNTDVCVTKISPVKNEVLESNVASTTPFNLFPPKGIFANLNFDDLFNSPNNSRIENKTSQSDKIQTNSINKLYGPLLPECLSSKTKSVKVHSIDSEFMEDEWVEKTESPKKESSHKNKHKKHKHKKKSKKKSHKNE